MSEPKGFCPFCDVPKWHICDHFLFYVRNSMGVDAGGNGRNRKGVLPIPAGAVLVNTGVSVRAYRKGRAS